MAACGIWLSRKRLVAVVVDDEGHAAPTVLSAMDDEERWALLQHVDAVHGLDWALVLTDDLLKSGDCICSFALEHGNDLLAAPQTLVHSIRLAAGLSTAPRIAAMIARPAIVPGFRGHLRRIQPSTYDSRQFRLF